MRIRDLVGASLSELAAVDDIRDHERQSYRFELCCVGRILRDERELGVPGGELEPVLHVLRFQRYRAVVYRDGSVLHVRIGLQDLAVEVLPGDREGPQLTGIGRHVG